MVLLEVVTSDLPHDDADRKAFAWWLDMHASKTSRVRFGIAMFSTYINQ
jgi:hypothetical protein